MKNTIKLLLTTFILTFSVHAFAGHSVQDIVKEVEKTAKTIERTLQNSNITDSDIEHAISKIVLFDNKIYGSALAFNPYILKKYFKLSSEKHNGKLLYSPYVYRGGSPLSFVNIGHIRPHQGYDYTAKAWYAKPMRIFKSSWSAPYFDEGAGNIKMITYSVPIGNMAVLTFDLPHAHKDNETNAY